MGLAYCIDNRMRLGTCMNTKLNSHVPIPLSPSPSLTPLFPSRVVAVVFQKRIVVLCAASLENKFVIKSQCSDAELHSQTKCVD